MQNERTEETMEFKDVKREEGVAVIQQSAKSNSSDIVLHFSCLFLFSVCQSALDSIFFFRSSL